MSIYEVIAFISILLALPKDRFRNSKALAIILIGVLIVVAAIRDLSVGTDTYGYYDSFIWAKSLLSGRTAHSEPIFAVFVYFCRQFLNYDWFMLLSYGIMFYSFLWVAYKKTTNFPLTVFLFITCGFYLSSFNGMREYLAAAIAFWALYVLEKDFKNERKKVIIFFSIILIASLIHNTALIVVFVFLIRNIDISNKKQFVIVVGSFVLGFFFSAFFWGFFQPVASEAGRFGTYLEYETGGGGRNIISNLGVNVMFLAVMFLANKQYQKSVFYKTYFVSMIVFNLVGSMDLLTRLTDNLAVAQIITIPIILRQTKNLIFKYGFIVLMLIYSISRFYLKGLSNPDILPYVVRPDIFGL